MLSSEQISEIREHLEKAQNPIFFFDNDIDGLMSFILLRRMIERGKGVAIKSFPELDVNYAKRIDEFNSDYVFILDKPVVSKEFIEAVEEKNLPIVWIDHHDVPKSDDNKKMVYYYNPMFGKEKSYEPVSYITYNVVNNKEDMWLAMAGCIADNFMPPFIDDFAKKYREFWRKDITSAFQSLYETDFGKLILIISFAMKDRTSNVVNMMNYLFKVRSPIEILKENDKNRKIYIRYNQVNRVYQKLLEKAKLVARTSKKVIFFQYGGELSLSSDLANELFYRFPGKIIIVAYVKGVVANVSIRGRENVRTTTLKAVEKIGNATGGGHENATGAKLAIEDLGKFVRFFEERFD